MTGPTRPAGGGGAPPPLLPTVILGAAMVVLGTLDLGNGPAALLVALFGAAGVAILERVAGGRGRAAAAMLALVALGVGALAATPGPAPELLAGIAGLAFLAWLAPPPTPTSGGRRRLEGLVLPGLAVGIAFATSAFLPPAPGFETVGIALLVGALAAIAFVLARPALLTPPRKALEAARGDSSGAADTARPSTVEGSL